MYPTSNNKHFAQPHHFHLGTINTNISTYISTRWGNPLNDYIDGMQTLTFNNNNWPRIEGWRHVVEEDIFPKP